MSFNDHLDKLHQDNFNKTGFRASFESKLTKGPKRSVCYTSLQAVEESLNYALNTHTLEEVQALLTRTVEAFTSSKDHARRQAGDIVTLTDEMDDTRYSNGEKTRWLIDASSDPRECCACNVFGCNEWPTLFALDEAGEPTGKGKYHVSECFMLDAPVTEESLAA